MRAGASETNQFLVARSLGHNHLKLSNPPSNLSSHKLPEDADHKQRTEPCLTTRFSHLLYFLRDKKGGKRKPRTNTIVRMFFQRASQILLVGSLCRSFSAAASHVQGVHVFQCPDAVGVVAKLSDCIASHGGNIHGVDVFVPDKKRVFYSRSEFVFDPARWPRAVMDNDFLTLSKFFNAEKSVVRVPDLDPRYKIAVLASKQEHCLVDLLYRWQEGRLPVNINRVISNHGRAPNTHVIRFLERHGIPYHYLPTTKINKREEEILALVEDTDFLVLARYMQILSGNFLKRYGRDVINIHHGLLPSFKGKNPSKQAFDAGVKLIGATSHFVTEELDAGPIIEQMVERVSHRDNLHSFVLKSENLEKQCLAQAIKSYCELRVLPYESNKTVVF